jgi:hypothetical protein
VKELKLIVAAIVALALLAIPGTAMAKSRDRDHDRLPDRWEHKHHLSTKAKNARRDPDGDGLRNLGEFRSKTNPRDADSDNDGLDDGDENRTANDPNDRDTDDDGVEDGDEVAGTITAWDPATGALTITSGGGEVSGVVTDATEIECEDEDDDTVVAAHDDGDNSNSGPGSGDDDSDDGDREDNSGPGSTSSGPGADGSDDGDDEGDDEDEDDACSAADLAVGTRVHEAELEIGSPNTWDEIEILR